MKSLRIQYKQNGMSLIEILIASVLGMFLIAGVIQIFSSSRQSYHMLENLSRMQENGRFAIDFISRDIRSTGHKARITGAAVCLSDSLPSSLTGTNNDGLNNSDSITIHTSDLTCPITVLSRNYTIANGAAGQPSLQRNGNELVEGIEDIQILYGEDTNDDKTPDHYVAAGTAGLDMSRVVSVRLTLTARTFDGNFVDSSEADGRIRRNFSSTIAIRNRLP